MKRYRVLAWDFDARANVLSTEIQESWDEAVKTQWRENKRRLSEHLVHDFGVSDYEAKIARFIEMGPKPFSIIAYHNKFLDQIRRAYVVGSFYPALTGVCALGERILNHLMFALRDSFKSSSHYKKVFRKSSFDDWGVAIDTLAAWEVWVEGVAISYRELMNARHRAIHFSPEIDTDDQQAALAAIKLLSSIIQKQFSGFGSQPWFIGDVPGASYIKKEWEINPFVKALYLPNGHLVGPRHRIDNISNQLVVVDDENYENLEITDAEFVRLLQEPQNTAARSVG
jgi:hypothetical protein